MYIQEQSDQTSWIPKKTSLAGFLSAIASTPSTLATQAIEGAISELRHLQERLNSRELTFGSPALPTEQWTPQLTAEGATWFSKGARSAAIDSINLGTARLDCLTAIQLAIEQGVRTALGDQIYNARGGSLAVGGTVFTRTPEGTRRVQVKDASELQRGDFVYFENPADYRRRHPGGAWRGENTVFLGDGKFLGFGVGEMMGAQLFELLAAKYNEGIPTRDWIAASAVKAQNTIFRFDEQSLRDLDKRAKSPASQR
jgi:hypothetical protein